MFMFRRVGAFYLAVKNFFSFSDLLIKASANMGKNGENVEITGEL